MKRIVAAGFALALALAGGWLAGRSSGSHDARERHADDSLRARNARDAMAPDGSAATPSTTPMRSVAGAGSGAGAPAAGVAEPLPAPDEPLAPHLDELRRRASRGDARAACRLAMELDACARLPLFETFTDATIAAAAANPAGGEHEAASQPWEKTAARLRKVCANVAPIDESEAFRWQMQSASAGQPEMLFRAAALPALRSGDILEHVPEWRQWREHALDFLQRAVANGDARAAMLLPDAFGSESNGRPRIAPVDPVQAYVYSRLRSRVAEASGDRNALAMAVALEKGEAIDAPARAAAEAEADRLFAAHFATRTPAELKVGDWGFDDFEACER